MQITEQMAKSAIETLVKLRDAVVDAVRDAGASGLPESYLHVALLQLNAPPSLPKRIVDTLVECEVFRRQHGRIYLAEVVAPQKGGA
jgi:hypothetical protein